MHYQSEVTKEQISHSQQCKQNMQYILIPKGNILSNTHNTDNIYHCKTWK